MPTFSYSYIYKHAAAGETSALLALLSQQPNEDLVDPDLVNLALIAAAEANQVLTVKALLDIGANIEGSNQRPWIRPLWKAAKRGHLEMVQLLVKRGADRNAKDNRGMTALDYALRYSRTAVAEFLVDD